MSMVNIARGNHHTKVSRDAYERIFKPKGYRIVGKQHKNESYGFYESDVPNSASDPVEVDIETIPVSDMSKEQLAEYAEKHNIDLKGVKNVREARQRIHRAIKTNI